MTHLSVPQEDCTKYNDWLSAVRLVPLGTKARYVIRTDTHRVQVNVSRKGKMSVKIVEVKK